MLRVDGLHAWYGKSHVLDGVSMRIEAGEIVSVLGRNGSGRSTLLKALIGLVHATGSAHFEGGQLVGRKTCEIARLGVGYVPENREIFARLTVEQNLELGRKPRRSPARQVARSPGAGIASFMPEPALDWSPGDAYEMFPALAARRRTLAGVLSGGEQQMLTLCRTLMGNPRLMLVDEPTEGLAPAVASQVAMFLRRLSERGVAILLAEQKLDIALDISGRCYLLGRGQVVFDGSPAELERDAAARREWLEV